MSSSAGRSTAPGVREELLRAAVALLDENGPDALQTRKVAGTAGTSTMAVYTHFGGMQQLIDALAVEGMRQFDAALTIPLTDDPVADLLATGVAYRRFALDRPHLYRLIFGSTSAHGLHAPAPNVLTLTVAEVSAYPSFGHVVRGVHRSIQAGRIHPADTSDSSVIATAVQFWTIMHGFVMLELAGFFGTDESAAGSVLGPMTTKLLAALGDAPDAVQRSLASAAPGMAAPETQKTPGT